MTPEQMIASIEFVTAALAHMQEHDKFPDDTCPADLYHMLNEVVAALKG